MTEPELRQLVMAAAKSTGVLAHYCGRSTLCQGDKGLPDLILLGRHGLVLAELKSRDGEVSPDQQQWLDRLERIEGMYSAAAVPRVLRPTDWHSGAVSRLLTRIR